MGRYPVPTTRIAFLKRENEDLRIKLDQVWNRCWAMGEFYCHMLSTTDDPRYMQTLRDEINTFAFILRLHPSYLGA